MNEIIETEDGLFINLGYITIFDLSRDFLLSYGEEPLIETLKTISCTFPNTKIAAYLPLYDVDVRSSGINEAEWSYNLSRGEYKAIIHRYLGKQITHDISDEAFYSELEGFWEDDITELAKTIQKYKKWMY